MIYNLNNRLERYRQIGIVLAKYGFGELIAGLPISKWSIWRIRKKHENLNRWQRIRLALEDLGPSFIKFGQIMSSRNDLLPEPLIIELSKLRESVPPFSYAITKKTIEKEFGQTIDSLFKEFDEKAIASASIGQVHKAVLNTGETVAVKIQRPDLDKTIKADIDIMRGIASVIQGNLHKRTTINLISLVEEFQRSIIKELDFYLEAVNIERFSASFEKSDTYYVPKVYIEYCTHKIITMEYIEGCSPFDKEALKKAGINPKQVAINGTNFVLKQIFEAGFFHADPHEGNIKIMDGGRICFLDYGAMGSMSKKSRQRLGELLLGFVALSPEKITEAVLNVCMASPMTDKNSLEEEVSLLMDKYAYIPLEKINLGSMLVELMDLVYRFDIQLPSSLYLLAKSIVTIEGIARELDKKFIFIDYLKPYAKKIVKERISAKTILLNSKDTADDIIKLIKTMPKDTVEILDQLKKGNTTINFEHKGLDTFTQKMEKTGNRLSFSLLIAALLLSSSIMTVSQTPPLWHNVSILGVGGFVLSGLMAMILLIQVIRYNKI